MSKIRVRVTTEYEIDADKWAGEYDIPEDMTVAEDVKSYVLYQDHHGHDFPDELRHAGVARTLIRTFAVLS